MKSFEPCPKCGGEIQLYSCWHYEAGYNCFARCQECNVKYPMPEINLKVGGVKIRKFSTREAEKAWNIKSREVVEK